MDRLTKCLTSREHRPKIVQGGNTEMAGCECEIMDSEVHKALKRVSNGKSLGLGLPLRQSHIFAPVLTSVFNNRFIEGCDHTVKDKHGGRELEDYRLITLLNTKLKIFSQDVCSQLPRFCWNRANRIKQFRASCI